MTQKHPVTTAELIYQIGQVESQIMQRRLTDIGIRMDHARILHYVSDVPGTNMVSLSSFLNIHPATLTNMIKKLEKQNLIIRRVDPTDSHQRQVFLLPEGQAVATKVTDMFHQLNDVVTSAGFVDPTKLQKLLMILEHYDEK